LKEYKVLVKEIGDKSLHEISEDNSLNIDPFEEKLKDKALYDLTAIGECLDVSIHEYDLERNKKQSFDNRAGLIITVLTAIIIAIYDKIPFKDIFSMARLPLTFILLAKIIITVLIYMLIVFSFYFAIRIIFVKITENFDIKIINGDFAGEAKIDSVAKLLEIYLNLTVIHRRKNEVFAEQLTKSQGAMIISIILIIAYLNLA
jgi:uncharacterized integral membrane protein